MSRGEGCRQSGHREDDESDPGSPEVHTHSDSALVKVMTEGKGNVKPVKTLTGKPEAVAAFLRTLKK
jgi:hypothetical protein